MAKKKQMSPKALAKLGAVFKVLGDGGRLALLQELKQGEKTVGELVELTGQGQATVSKSLKMMSEAGLLERKKEGVRVFYRVEDRLVFDLCELVCGKLNRDHKSLSEIEYSI
ncbi:metalloregulator ArsR/SmtB family transcription factor [Akkermansiaceae bacterium]|jgi:ArsR family transcriptional regulator|nr:metalloregulator ArsR/SmtB family transcription factor [Akkermansiaceae bacterium]MDA7917819.1 metalloregulator ArsR/SmtB family transcription factor [bacterium]MDA9831486.1 metalloregulator ArsR/SmtB family transcription factor [Akkermansiaceae bacterium]MDF1713686.1 metalloregulator ArsR/SmtB family transcription factor [Akkermansiaceae bacterium]